MLTNCLDAMDREELVRLAGEQALLNRDLQKLRADQERDLNALRNLAGEIGRDPQWFDRGTSLLARLRERERELADGQERVRQLSKLTGI